MNTVLFKIINLIIAIFYSSTLLWSYISWISPVWGYLGFSYNQSYEGNYFYYLLIILLCSIPSLWIPIRLRRPTMVVYWMLFYMTYIPMIIGVSLSENFIFEDVILFDLGALISFFICGLGYRVALFDIRIKKLDSKVFWSIFIAITVIFFCYTLFVFKGNLQFITFFAEELYELRFSGRDIESANPLVGYVILWLSGAFLPFILAFGIIKEKKIVVAYAIAGQVLLYMTMANKAFILSIVFMCFIYLIIKRNLYLGTILGLILGLLIALFNSLAVFTEGDLQLIFFPLSSLFLIRTIGTSALTANLYYDFFNSHPHTYYSHVSIINKFIPYPYGTEMMGVVIGEYYTSISRFNVNANMFITDGLAAIGVFGMPIIGAICCFVFFIIDSVSLKHDIKFTTLLLSYAGINIMNVSLFTSIISGGLFFTILFLIFYKLEDLDL